MILALNPWGVARGEPTLITGFVRKTFLFCATWCRFAVVVLPKFSGFQVIENSGALGSRTMIPSDHGCVAQTLLIQRTDPSCELSSPGHEQVIHGTEFYRGPNFVQRFTQLNAAIVRGCKPEYAGG